MIVSIMSEETVTFTHIQSDYANAKLIEAEWRMYASVNRTSLVQVMACHYLSQCWIVANWIPGNKFQWNLNQNTIFIQENAIENAVCKNSVILYQTQCVNLSISGPSYMRDPYWVITVFAATLTHDGTWPLARYVKVWVAHALGMPGTFSPPPQASDPDMHHGTCVTHVPWCMPGSLTS